MCRRNILPAAALIAFGIGALLSVILGGGFLSILIAVAAITGGVLLLRQNRCR